MVIEGGSYVRSIPMGLVLACGLVSFATLAAEERLRLTWSAPPGCPSTEEVRRAASKDVDVGDRAEGPPLDAQAHVEERPAGDPERRFRVVLRTRRGRATGRRVIEASTCQGVAEATAVILSLALASPGAAAGDDESQATFELESPETSADPPDPGVREEPRPGPHAEPAPAGRASPRTAEGDTPAPAGSSQGSPSFALGAQLAAERGTLPSWALGGSLLAAWMPGHLRLEADARRWAPRSKSVVGSPAGARFHATSLGLRGCYALWRKAIELSPCAGADVHLVSARGYGADTNHDVAVRWLAVTAGALGRRPLTPWLALRGRVEASVPLERSTFFVERIGEVHRAAPVGLAAFFGAEALFF